MSMNVSAVSYLVSPASRTQWTLPEGEWFMGSLGPAKSSALLRDNVLAGATTLWSGLKNVRF